ncbi:hypothetical protein L6Q21_14990 [Sandaracinobacter sp. RS1-74]|uniref:hypothetical protein n=1 Tax=Sandaracinobacteroides sayramensis TaxID=2913411 RepID=UPI001EDC0AC5|nr:hypothetical protein [Sandaracinobacteroides sayramensis]MCG2842282.1 hypothetical protein [Sandaracinobacteroides sayramensis]
MGDDTEPERFRPANDNSGPNGEPDAETWRRIDHTALTLVRIIARRMAREDFERLTAANDNRPIAPKETEDGADTD